MKSSPWRVGRKVGRTIYEHDRLIGLMDTPELAAQVVQAVNGQEAEPVALREALQRIADAHRFNTAGLLPYQVHEIAFAALAVDKKDGTP